MKRRAENRSGKAFTLEANAALARHIAALMARRTNTSSEQKVHHIPPILGRKGHNEQGRFQGSISVLNNIRAVSNAIRARLGFSRKRRVALIDVIERLLGCRLHVAGLEIGNRREMG